MNELALFAGIGGGILGGKLLGWRTVGAVEISAYCARRLMQRQNEGHLPPFPIWDDVCTFDGRCWRGIVDVVSGGFPCQGISVGNTSATGLSDPRSGLWREFARIVCEIRPLYVFVENSPALTFRGLGQILCDLAKMGYDAKWGVLGDADAGGNTERKRIWIVAHTPSVRRAEILRTDQGGGGNPTEIGQTIDVGSRCRIGRIRALEQVAGEPAILGSGGGISNPVDRLHAIGNAQFPGVVRLAWETLKP